MADLRGAPPNPAVPVKKKIVKCGDVRVSPRIFLKNECKWCLMSPFCRLLVNIFSNFPTTPRIYVLREYFHL